MINVLPESGRSVVRREYLLRLISFAFLCLGAALFISSVSLLPSYLAARERGKGLARQLELAESSLRRETETSIGKEITFAGLALPVLEKSLSFPRPSLYMNALLETRGASVSLSRLEFSGGEEHLLRLTGRALTRDVLIAFSRRASQLKGSPKVDLPVSNLVKSADVPFSLSVRFTSPL